jgi:peptide/nickel transport system ATP-binding protein
MNEDARIVLSGRDISRYFGLGRKRFAAVNHVDFDFREGQIVSIVGASGSGKTTLAKILLGLLKESGGEIEYLGKKRILKTPQQRKEYWGQIQAIFQDPFASFNQFHRVERLFNDCIKMQGLKLTQEEAFEKMRHACTFVNLKFEELYNKYPFELSGGQMQRLMIARIFMINPKILIADEPTSMIDACSRSTILDMLLKLRVENKMTIIFITHDMGLAYYVSDNIFIMEQGSIIERGTAEEVISSPKVAYTKQLLSDVPKLNEEWNLV